MEGWNGVTKLKQKFYTTKFFIKNLIHVTTSIPIRI
jgi:hypothetical protein